VDKSRRPLTPDEVNQILLHHEGGSQGKKAEKTEVYIYAGRDGQKSSLVLSADLPGVVEEVNMDKRHAKGDGDDFRSLPHRL